MGVNEVSNPSHYTYGEWQPKDFSRAWGLNFNLGSAIKYITRYRDKGNPELDLKKANEFLLFEIRYLEQYGVEIDDTVYKPTPVVLPTEYVKSLNLPPKLEYAIMLICVANQDQASIRILREARVLIAHYIVHELRRELKDE